MCLAQSIPCRRGEEISVWADGKKLISSKIPLLIQSKLDVRSNYRFSVFIDSSESMADVLNIIEKGAKKFQQIIGRKVAIYYPQDERWIQWFAAGLSSQIPTVTVVFQNEDSLSYYNYDNVIYEVSGSDVYAYYGKIPSSLMASDLTFFANQYRFSQPSCAHLFIVDYYDYFRTNTILAFQQPDLSQANYSYIGIGEVYSARQVLDLLLGIFGDLIGDLTDFVEGVHPLPDISSFIKRDEFFVKVFALQPSLARDWLSDLTTAPFNSILPGTLFLDKVAEYQSDKPINIKTSCDSRCPDGYCEISIPVYPYFCCIKV